MRSALKRILAAALLAAVPLLALGEPATSPAGTTATELIGSTLKTAQGEPIGRVRDLVIDVRASAVRYIVVERPGGGEKVLPYPPGAEPAAQGRSARSGTDELVRADHFLYRGVRDVHGKSVGAVQDLGIDPATGKVRYAIVGLAPGRGTPSERLRVPLRALRLPGGEGEGDLILEPGR